ncbi:NAD+ synthase [Aquifex aeolicus]|uniref:Glutamine-dependent NAD(+) synthetase n=1 Tax=Aquifex aeolicus (strain VF5) TaxID=224324 RepID=NADE_AQUAE|nr:NAD+ synthase [Aquifex aeolicus]O67091.1 RecName: Full=Glutamine-dependent NAD(+) synthetase; AltName: Full=NAD(+) synthase [glutamine-hydrolyzing] [Aquifex aeolicus VF5]AAC07044.1 NH(3)-dependent NAD+ synthetase [Aquifex aeolicus VF5]
MLNLTLAQLNFTVGDVEGNKEKILKVIDEYSEKSHIIAFPELSLSGYPPEDLLLQPHFLKECEKAFDQIIHHTRNYDVIVAVGLPYYEFDLYNALAVIHRGEVLGIYKKHFLPNYSVFDEYRYFRKGEEPLMIEVNGHKVSFSICEDIWYPDGVERQTALSGAELIVNVNASPYHVNKYSFKESFLKSRAEDNLCFVAYVNLVGGQDELVFDGRSIVISPFGKLVARAKAFEEDILTVTLDLGEAKRKRLLDLRWREGSYGREKVNVKRSVSLPDKEFFRGRIEENPKEEEEIYAALKLSLRDYVRKNGFEKVVLGLSGGIDSSFVACLAVDALGRENVKGVYMPSQFSSKESYEDAKALAQNLGIEFHVIPIKEIYRAYFNEFEKEICEITFDVADENIQARIRANILFYFSNKFRYLVLSTSNKSETAVGYTTIYGDMAGGFAPIKDVYKTWVYKLARYRNSISPDIPERVFKKPPSAELRPNQTDQDVLPPYEILDQILMLYIEENLSPEEIIRKGLPRDAVYKTINMIRKNEYKRKQAPIGPKITSRAFGKDWRMPVTNKFFK